MKSLIEIPKTMKALVLHEIGKLTLDEVPVASSGYGSGKD